MAVQPIELLDVAKSLLPGSESLQRTVANRAYYAIYHMAASLVGTNPSAKSSHSWIIHQLEHFPDKQQQIRTRKIAGYMRECRKIRRLADYVLEANFLRKHAELAIALADEVANLMTQTITA